ncbi:plastocyanin/azurin family copper-binding protein [Halobacterium rubrum]|uniref:plastocyanin/azurin family copper-binding protein n=1 Tax=Halobacterium TaxID=2239 RepID=UPI001F032B12|nr:MULTISPECIES: plastocyanin/azurin family copper-binding protein [Halobacterium]MDH5019792.1 plastocyanin/azurin family copper-binding protein [Halobacterium rubrum]
MDTDRPTRRAMLALSGSALAAATAGCTGLTGGTADDSTTEEDGHHDDEHDGTTEEDGHHEEEGDGHDDEHGESGPAEHVEVPMLTRDDGHHFHPHVAWVEVGGTVTWTLDSGAHATAAYHPDNGDRPQRIPDGADPWDSGIIDEEGATFEVTFDTEGVYDYYCAPHEAGGMLGSVIVGEPDAHDQPGLAEPQSSLPEGAQSKLADLNEMVNEKLGHTH